jgi:hypothetical protein
MDFALWGMMNHNDTDNCTGRVESSCELCGWTATSGLAAAMGNPAASMMWNDAPCGAMVPFICQRPLVSSAEQMFTSPQLLVPKSKYSKFRESF